jgi:hypothetical protein
VHLLARAGVGHEPDGGFVRNPTTLNPTILWGASPPPSLTYAFRATRGTCRGTRHKRAGGAEPIWRRHVSAESLNDLGTGRQG